MQRRQFIASGSVLAAFILAGCEQGLHYSLAEVVRRLLTVSSQRALSRLIAPGGFYDNQVARITLPDELSGKGQAIARILITSLLRDRLQRQVNEAAAVGAERAAPVIADAIISISPQDAAAIVRGNGPLATDLLRQHMGDALFSAMLPGVDEGLRTFDSQVVQDVLKVATGIDFAGLRRDIARKASDAIFAEMGREEVAIRADPRSSRDPVLIEGLGGSGYR